MINEIVKSIGTELQDAKDQSNYIKAAMIGDNYEFLKCCEHRLKHLTYVADTIEEAILDKEYEAVNLMISEIPQGININGIHARMALKVAEELDEINKRQGNDETIRQETAKLNYHVSNCSYFNENNPNSNSAIQNSLARIIAKNFDDYNFGGNETKIYNKLLRFHENGSNILKNSK